MAHDSGYERVVQPFHEAIASRMVGHCTADVDSTQLGCVLEELQLELTSLFGLDDLCTTEARYLTGE
jgi:hypothetical protein